MHIHTFCLDLPNPVNQLLTDVLDKGLVTLGLLPHDCAFQENGV